MFDIGFSELVLVFIVGLIVLGPQRMPVAIRTVVGWIRTLRGLATTVQNELSQELKLQELQDSIKKAESLNLQQLSPELSKTVEELKESAKKMQANLHQTTAEIDAEIQTAKDKVDHAIQQDLNPNKEEIVEQSTENPSELTALSPSEQAAPAEENDIMVHLQKYQTTEDFTKSSTTQKS